MLSITIVGCRRVALTFGDDPFERETLSSIGKSGDGHERVLK